MGRGGKVLVYAWAPFHALNPRSSFYYLLMYKNTSGCVSNSVDLAPTSRSAHIMFLAVAMFKMHDVQCQKFRIITCGNENPY